MIYRSWVFYSSIWGISEHLGYLRLHIPTVSCCRQCKELDWGKCDSSGCRSSYQRSGREEHDAGGWEIAKRETTMVKVRIMWCMSISAGNISLPKRAPLHILTTEPYMDSIVEQRAKGHIFPKSPVTHALTHHVCTSLQDTSQTWKKTDMNVDCGAFWMKQAESGERGLPPWMVKSFSGTDDATLPMWQSCSSVMPVDSQLILLGSPSRVKNSADPQAC